MSKRKRREENEKSNAYGMFVLGVAAVLLSLALFLWYIGRNRDVVIRQNEKYILDASVTAAEHVNNELDHAEILIFNLSESYAHILKGTEERSILDILELLNQRTVFDRVVFITPDGTNHSLEGEAQVGDREYFVEGMKGRIGRQWLTKSRITGKGSIIFYAPVQYDGEVIGVLAGHYENEQIKKILHTEFMGVNPETILMDGDGNTLAYSGDDTELVEAQNLFEAINDENLQSSLSEDTVRRIFLENKSKEYKEKKSFNIDLTKDDSTTILSIAPLASHGWYVMHILPASVTRGMTSDINRSGIILTAMLMFIFVIFALLIYYIISKQKAELQEAVTQATETSSTIINKLRTSYMQERQYREAMVSNAKIHYNVNLTKDQLLTEIIEVSEGKTTKILQRLGLKAPCSYTDMINKWKDDYVETSHKGAFQKRHDRNFLLDQYKSGYRNLNHVWEFASDELVGKGNIIYQNIVMTENTEGDIMALIVLKELD